MDPLSKALKRTIDFHDTAGIHDAAGKLVPFCRLPNGRLFPPFGEQYINNVKTTKLRPDDIFVCGYPKSGCHWTWEIMVMILKGKPEYSKIGKVETMLELASPELPAAVPSPRILNTHVWYEELPDEIKKYNNKIVLTTRNPKDTAVSHYNHHINMPHIYHYDGKFNDWVLLWIEGLTDYGGFVEFHQKWDTAIRDDPKPPILVVNYEEMRENLEPTVRKLAEFLSVTLTEQQIQEITEAADFNTMKEKFKGLPTEVLIRKGQVGDWKNWFTVASSDAIDKWRPDLDKTLFKFRYLL
ncbi:unnamed protein product [Lymnaea stagnalis]|uniref:Sulfotransferase domain-containing protein n=1 Tax=Lymnaea stagnalis TaxID=6523 RepID=A0AAV2HXE1_LYMST